MKMRDIIRIVEGQTPSIRLYHGTSEPAAKIKQHGLIPGRLDAVFLTDNPQLAVEYAETDRDRTESDTMTMVKVNAHDLDPSLLYADVDHTGNTENWLESLRETDQCIYRGPIPPHLLTVEAYDEDADEWIEV